MRSNSKKNRRIFKLSPEQKFEKISFIVDTESAIHVMAKEMHFQTKMEFGDFCHKANLIKSGLDLIIEAKQALREDMN
jgi:hypothetical protein